MHVHVIIERNLGVQRRVRTAGKHHRKGLIQRVHPYGGRAIALGQRHVGAGNGVGGALAVQVLKGGNAVVVAAHDQRGADVAIGGGEIILLGTLLGDLHAVGGHVVAAGIQTGEDAVPFGLHKLGGHAQLGGDGLRHLHVEAYQHVVFIVICPRSPCAFRGDNDFALRLNAGQLIFALGGGQREGQYEGQQDAPKCLDLHVSSSF